LDVRVDAGYFQMITPAEPIADVARVEYPFFESARRAAATVDLYPSVG
jgi:hypothetical protein